MLNEDLSSGRYERNSPQTGFSLKWSKEKNYQIDRTKRLGFKAVWYFILLVSIKDESNNRIYFTLFAMIDLSKIEIIYL